MANYTFETMTESDAAAFTGADRLIFLSGSPTTVSVVHHDPTSGLHATAESITITEGTLSHTFSATDLATASQNNNLIFLSGNSDTLLVDSDAATTLNLNTIDPAFNADAPAHTVFYAFGGADNITGGDASDWIDAGNGADTITGFNDGSDEQLEGKTDVLQGGTGADTITGSAGNDHIYGNTIANANSADDGADHLNGGAGNDYIQGNVGADVIDGGADNDRLYGGADGDTITGGTGNDYLQGNKGADTLSGDAGNDVVHGGADNDTIGGGADNDWLYGDNGNDVITGGTGYDTLTGGAGKDNFVFAAGDADLTDVTDNSTGHTNRTDEIVDFTSADDKIVLGFTVDHVLVDKSGTTFANVDGAYQSAGTILATATGGDDDVVALQVGNDTYLFFHGAGAGSTAVDSAIKLDGIHASDVAASWFA